MLELLESLAVLALVVCGLLLMVGSGPKLANRFFAWIFRTIWRGLERLFRGVLRQLWRLGGRFISWLWHNGWRALRELFRFLIWADREASRRWPRGTIVFYLVFNTGLAIAAVVIFFHFFV